MTVLRSAVPFYHQIAQVLRQRLELGETDRMPAEYALCEEFGVSRTTVRQALLLLKGEGLVESRRGIGTRCAPAMPRKKLVRAWGDPLHGALPSRPRIISVEKNVPAPIAVAEFFGVPAGTSMFRAVRVHDLDGAPLSVVVSYLEESMGGVMTKRGLRDSTMHDLLWQHFGLRQKRSVHTLKVARADARYATLLQIGLADPVLRIQSRVYLSDGRPVRWTENVFREDRYEYSAEMEWPDPESQSLRLASLKKPGTRSATK